MSRVVSVIIVFLAWAGIVAAQHTGAGSRLSLAAVFSDHMVLQRNKPLTIYGKASPGATVQVSFADHSKAAAADGEGRWKVTFPARQAGGPYQIAVSENDQRIIVKDILIGDVWLCSGQSNMDFQLKDAKTGPEELKGGEFGRNIRLLRFHGSVPWGNVSWDSAALEKINRFEYFKGSWQLLDATSAATFSAVGYYFGKNIATAANVPIGLVQVALGGSTTESWIDKGILARDSQFGDMLTNWSESEQVMEWCRGRAAANLANARSKTQWHPFQPGYNYQAGIAPLTDFPIAGAIWYQGESNVHDIALHEKLFETLVKNWRESWGYAFPFYYVQLSSIQRANWPEFRDSQRQMLAKIPHAGMAVSYDLGDSLDVHPTRKKEIGERLAALALKDVYRKAVVASGPVARKAAVKNGRIVLEFTSAQKLLTLNNTPLNGFELVTREGRRFAAPAAIENNRVTIAIPPGEQVKTVLYAYQPFTRANLYNEAGLPAPTFSIPVQ